MAETYLPLGCFGKLSFYGDYLKVGVSHPTARALIDLMLHGTRELAADESDHGGYKDVAVQTSHWILFGEPGSKELLLGVSRPSGDSGGRHFPFVLFTHVPRKIYGRHYSLLPLALTPVWVALAEAWEALAESATRDGFEEALEGIELPDVIDVKEARGDFQGRQREDAGKLFEGRKGASPASLAQKMPELLERLRKSGDDGLSVQLPVATDLGEACFNVSVWLDLINNQFRLRRFEPSVFLDERTTVDARVVVLRFGPLGPSDYPDIIGRPRPEAFLRPAHAESPVQESSGDRAMTYGDFLGARY
jgi:type VI secretion system ImpM family protein